MQFALQLPNQYMHINPTSISPTNVITAVFHFDIRNV